MNTVTAPATEKLSVLTSTSGEGDFVHQNQEMGTKEGFRNVSKLWLDKTLTFDEGMAQIEAGRAQTEDIMGTVNQFVATMDKDEKFAFHHLPSNRYFRPTEHAIKQVGGWAETGTWYVESMISPITDNKGRLLAERDKQDAETLAAVINNGFRRIDPAKQFLFRTRKNGTLRAMLSDRFAIIDNRWFVDVLRGILPDARLSHWRGDSDTLWGNLLIPDTIRAEQDSEYGGMLSVGNSEIGERRISSCPSIFRAICMNGCIWGSTKGNKISQVHRGKIDLSQLAGEIKENLKKQIPLLATGIDKLLALREHDYTGTATKSMFAALAREYKLNKKQASACVDAWNVERIDTPELSLTLFCLTNSITRAGQKFSNAEWVKFDEIGGQLAGYSQADFVGLVSKAKSLNQKDVDDSFNF